MSDSSGSSVSVSSGFTFLTNHAHVLLLIAGEANVRMRELAVEIGITERAIQRIVDDLSAAGYLVVTKEGRRNHYQVQLNHPLRHPLEKHCQVRGLVDFVYPSINRSQTERAKSASMRV
jgi:predicted transcriptional regulator